MSNRSETFGRLLKGAINSIATYEGKTAPVIEEELAEKVSLAGSAFQRYKSGYLPPEPRTIEIIAEAAVRRGLFSREWLQRFLHASRYHQADKLLDLLCPIGPARPRPPRVYQNLPAPTYSQFVERKEASAEVLEGLSKRSAAVIIVGLGGNGKTSLAREIADHCLKGEDGQALFDAAVWVSDKDRPGTTNLSIVLDEISRTLDYPGFTQFEHDEKRREVEQLLRRQRVLVCVDNFETITDGALLSWLLNLPEPSKALITTREYRREYRRGGWPVELRGMSDSEARSLISERLKVLRVEKFVSDNVQLDPLVAATGGNPKAIEITLGIVKYERRSLGEVVDDLYAARGELFDDLFSRAWALLDEAARRLLLVMTFFPTSASNVALSTTADVQGYALDRALERLVDLALVDEQRLDLEQKERYALHPLVRSFAGRKRGEKTDFEEVARDRWIGWCISLTAHVGYCWDNLNKLELLDPEEETIFEVINWCFEKGRYADAVAIINNTGYFFHVRGIWKKKLVIERIHLDAARIIGDNREVTRATAYLAETLCRTWNLPEVEGHLAFLAKAIQEFDLQGETLFRAHNAIGMYWLYLKNYANAQKAWEGSLQHATHFLPITHSINLQWLAACYYEQGHLNEAEDIFTDILRDATKQGYQRYIVSNKVHLARVYLDRRKLTAAKQLLEEACSSSLQYQDRGMIAYSYRFYARLQEMSGELSGARDALKVVIENYERLGMRRELAEAREELRRLDELGEAPAA